MTNILTRNPKSKLIALIVTVAVFGVLYIISQAFLKSVYLFEWASRGLYYYIWVPALLLIAFDKPIISYSITFGNVLGLIVGQLLGDFIRTRNMALITPETPPDQEYFLSYHKGAFIWIITVLICAALGIAVQIITSKRKAAA